MTVKDFVKWVLKIPQLNKSQRDECGSQLSELAADEVAWDVPQAIAETIPECCPHCKHDKLGKWGHASGLQRWRCGSCSKTFNCLTRTPLARLRKKEKWLDNAKSMIAGQTIEETAHNCGVHRNTAFLWRHRFLECHQRAQCKDLSGIAESDATYFYRSEKGSKTLEREPRQRGGDGIGPGLSHDLVPVVTLRDRSGNGADRVAPSNLGLHAQDLYQVHLKPDTLLLTDGGADLCAAARFRNPEAHRALVGTESRGGNNSPFHLQTTNGFHSSMKNWMRRFHGVATKYLANYMGWYRHLFEGTHGKDPNTFIALSFRPLSVSQQLIMI